MEIIKTIIALLSILMTIVCVHEAGHLIAAKIFNVYCEEYSIGMGPLIWKHNFKETQFSVRCLPIGGFVKIAGEQEDGIQTKHKKLDVPFERTLPGVSRWKQIIIMLSGIFMNFVLSVLLMFVGYMTYKVVIPEVISVTPWSQFQVGDTIVSANNAEIVAIDDLIKLASAGNEVEFVIERNNKTITESISPSLNEKGEYSFGIQLNQVKLGVVNSFIGSLGFVKSVSTLIGDTLKQLFTTSTGYQNVGGVISMYNMVSDLQSLVEYLAIASMLSVNVGIVNAIPLPTMDGGRVVITIIEGLRGKRLTKKQEYWVFGISLILLLLIFITVTSLDILRLMGKL